MSGARAWAAPQPPPYWQRSRDGRLVDVLGPTGIPETHTAPLLQAEVRTWRRPSAAASFPLHPLGVLHLYDRAMGVIEEAGALDRFSAEDRGHVERLCSRFAGRVFAPGLSIRSALDRAIDGRWLSPRDDDEGAGVLQAAHLAAWAVVQAAAEWAGEGEE